MTTGKSRVGARPNEERFEQRAGEVLAFLKEHHRLPYVKSSDPRERGMRFWLNHQTACHKLGELSPRRERIISKILKATEEQALSPGVAVIVSFQERNGRMPDHLDPEEYLIYARVIKARRRYRDGVLSAKDIRALASIPGLLEPVRQDWNVQLKRLQEWCRRSGHLPRHTIRVTEKSRDQAIEQGLGQWMYRAVNRRPGAKETTETVAIRNAVLELRRQYPSYSMAPLELGSNRVLEFIQANDRLPYARGAEARLYRDALAVKSAPQGRELGPKAAGLLDLVGSLPDRTESEWDSWFEEVGNFALKYGFVPLPGNCKGQPQLRLAKWVARESGPGATVTDPIRARSLRELLDEYAPQAA